MTQAKSDLQIAVIHLVERHKISKAVEDLVKTSIAMGTHTKASEVHALVLAMAGLPEKCAAWSRTQYIAECFMQYYIPLTILHGIEVYRNIDLGFSITKAKRKRVGYKTGKTPATRSNI